MQYVLYVIVIIAKAPWLILKFLLRNKVALIAVIVCLIGLMAYKTLSRHNPTIYDTPKPAYQEKEPSADKASLVFVPQYGGHIFEVNTYESSGNGSYVLTDFYYYDRKKWEHSTTPYPMDKSIFGNIKIIKK
jgi:hypothetical protein